MLYRYPTEQKKTAQETAAGNKRYDTYTGEELPPIPYINQGGTALNAGTAAGSGTKTTKNTKTSATANAALSSAATSAIPQQNGTQADYLKALFDLQKSYLGSSYNASRKQAAQDNEDSMRDLYIAYMQGIKNMPQQTALWGAGGEIESLKTQHRLNYENNRAKQSKEYGSIMDDIQQRYNADLLELEQKYLREMMNL